jgi:hypothetical protein
MVKAKAKRKSRSFRKNKSTAERERDSFDEACKNDLEINRQKSTEAQTGTGKFIDLSEIDCGPVHFSTQPKMRRPLKSRVKPKSKASGARA